MFPYPNMSINPAGIPRPGSLPYPPLPEQEMQMLPPVTNQPTGIQGAEKPGPVQYNVINSLTGLEYLTQVNQLWVEQKIEVLELLTGYETQNEYKIKNATGQDIYYASEENDCCTMQCCGPIRPFDLTIKDNAAREVIHVYRPLNCDSCCFPCCLQEIEVSSPPGNIIGSVEQKWAFCKPRFVVKDQNGIVVLRIEGPFCTTSICGQDVEFQVLSEGSFEVGKLTKKWSGYVKEACTDADIFGITFPIDLDAKIKATLLGAVFLIDFMYFESKPRQNRH